MDNREHCEQQLLKLTHQFLQESGAIRAARAVHMDAKLERELGIGSLEKAELFHRIEMEFDIKLPELLLAQAKTLNDVYGSLTRQPYARKTHSGKIERIALEKSTVNLQHAATLNDVIRLYAEKDAERPYLYFQHEDAEEVVTYGNLYQQALKVAQGLIHSDIFPGDTVAIMLPSSAEFFYAFYGILLAGAIPVPIYPPMRVDQIAEYINKEAKILFNAGVKLLISFKEAKTLTTLLKPFVPTLLHITDVANLLNKGTLKKNKDVAGSDIALLQYTSGSTGNPKGVILTHNNLLANIYAYGKAVEPTPADVVVSWLPLYHDMGLIGVVLGCLYYGMPLILMSPLTFLSSPEKWLWSIHYRRGTLSAAPNFAYELCAKKIKDEDIYGLDLSSWRLAFNGAEAIHPQTLERFYRRFSAYGFRQKAFFPVYGLAESSLALTFPIVGREPKIDSIDRKMFETQKKAVPVKDKSQESYAFVSCGSPLLGHEICIVDDHDNILSERHIGKLRFRGPSSMQGYYHNAEATREAYHNGWWDTGDLAYLAEGELYITGRKKDLIIKAGKNYYPPEIEEAVSEVSGIRKGCVVAFGVCEPETGTEKLIVVAEKGQSAQKNEDELIEEIREKVMAQIAIPPDEVILVSARTIPKTSSGKLQRSSCKQLYEKGTLTKAKQSMWIQLTRLLLSGWGKKLLHWVTHVGKAIYTLYITIIFLLTFVPVVCLTYLLSRDNAARIIKVWSKLMLVLSLCPLKVSGKQLLKKTKAQIFVSNHTSYVDIILLLSILPIETRFVAKKELKKIPIVRGLIKKLGHIYVDRMDITQSEKDMQNMAKVISQGHAILFFPEGTFTFVAGVRPFKLGPFKIAAAHHLLTCPISIYNARKILRANQFLFCPSSVKVTILEGRHAGGQEWQDIVQIRDWARMQIVKHSGEQPLDLIAAGPEL